VTTSNGSVFAESAMPANEDRRLARLTAICRTLPEAERELRGDYATFKVRKKTFAYFLNDHHGDGIVSVCFKMAAGDNSKVIALDDERFYLPTYIGPRGWAGLRLDLGKVDWEEIAEFIVDSYRLVAPQRLVAQLKLPQRERDSE
jgi:predicted DNA-binding protein (MmcQ/YjbR family)